MPVRTVTGQVLRNGQPLPDSSVFFRGQNYHSYSYARTDENGYYNILQKDMADSTFKVQINSQDTEVSDFRVFTNTSFKTNYN